MTKPSEHSSTSRGEKLANRLSHILALLHQGDSIDKHQLAQQFQVDVRTIERDLGERLCGIIKRNAEGQWQLNQTQRGTIPANYLHGYARLAGTEYLFPDSSQRYLLEQLETPQPQRATQVQPVPHEDLGEHSGTFALLQTAVEHKHECRFDYKDKPRLAQPYRLIHKNGIWYLAALEAGLLKNFSVALITGLQVDEASRFTPDPTHQAYINNKDDVWFTTQTTEVLLRVAPEVAHYFTRRQLLPQQKQHAYPDGSLCVSTSINHPNQLLPVVQYWLPNVRIMQPAEWHELLMERLRQALEVWEEK